MRFRIVLFFRKLIHFVEHIQNNFENSLYFCRHVSKEKYIKVIRRVYLILARIRTFAESWRFLTTFSSQAEFQIRSLQFRKLQTSFSNIMNRINVELYHWTSFVHFYTTQYIIEWRLYLRNKYFLWMKDVFTKIFWSLFSNRFYRKNFSNQKLFPNCQFYDRFLNNVTCMLAIVFSNLELIKKTCCIK